MKGENEQIGRKSNNREKVTNAGKNKPRDESKNNENRANGI